MSIVYGIFSVIGGFAIYTNLTDGISQPIVSMALGLGTGTHLVLFVKNLIEDFR
jgi:hypothetical protein